MPENITRIPIGLNRDNSFEQQQEGTYPFALNAVLQNRDGNQMELSNEESNTLLSSIKKNHTVIGNIYMSDGDYAIFSVDESINNSNIGIFNTKTSKYKIVVDDISQRNKLGFKIGHQIQGVYRLRRGCENTIYFTDNNMPPRYFNFNDLNYFKSGGEWDIDKFRLQKRINKVPTLAEYSILNQGSLLPGSVSVFFQYLDEDFNGTEFIPLIEHVNIYNDSLSSDYSDIHGTMHKEGEGSEAYSSGKTSKALSIELRNIDINYRYYRLAFVEYTSGTGSYTRVIYSNPISTDNNNFLYTGENGAENGVLEDIIFNNSYSQIEKVKNMVQLDNMLIMSNVQGPEVELCKLQRYASKIKADAVLKNVILTNIDDENNAKNPFVYHNGTGYMPGEVYSFGIVWVFSDNSESPVYHIPGKSPSAADNLVFSPSENVYPMRSSNNYVESLFYNERESCIDGNYWGKDSEGYDLKGKNVRHHRFPTRKEIGVNFVNRIEETSSTNNTLYKKVTLLLEGDIDKSIECTDEDVNCTPYNAPIFVVTVRYKRNGLEEEFSDTMYPDGRNPITSVSSPAFLNTDIITNIKVYYQVEGSDVEEEITLGVETDYGITYSVTEDFLETDNSINHFKVPIFGIKFSNIELPPKEIIGKEVIGYKIVRQDRKDSDKTILDTGVLLPTVKNKKFVASSVLHPEWDNCEVADFEKYNSDCFRSSKNNVMLLSPEHKFKDRTFDEFTTIEKIGEFEVTKQNGTAFTVQDVFEGSSASDNERNPSKDDDGYSLRHTVREHVLDYKKTIDEYIINRKDTTLYNLEGISWADTNYEGETLYNLSSDNKSLFISHNKGEEVSPYKPSNTNIPFVVIKREYYSFYSNFRTANYYSVDNKIHKGEEVAVFGGDSYVTPLRYTNHLFLNAIAAFRRQKASAWQIIGAGILMAVGTVFAVLTGGASALGVYGILGGILTGLGGVALGIGTFVSQGKFNSVYAEKWDLGLDKTVYDKFLKKYFYTPFSNSFEPIQWRDDTFKWHGEIFSDFWFETSINASLRVMPTTHDTNYLHPLKSYMTHKGGMLRDHASYMSNNPKRYYDFDNANPEGTEENYFFKKITRPDPDKKDKSLYNGISAPIIYMLNPDHNITEGVKAHYPLSLSYDCCSDCQEKFPHRWIWSEQSFQEELTDNYRTFLPNNYKDIPGETGEITNMFTMSDNLFIHTEEALWLIPKSLQERVTDQIITFIGDGSYGEMPARKIVDDSSGNSAGSRHKFGLLKTPSGVFFPCEQQGTIYQFNGEQLNPISDRGLSNWFKENLPIKFNKFYRKTNNKNYEFNDNTSNKIGTGIISAYDSRYERILFTKKDFLYEEDLGNDFELCYSGNNSIIFDNFSQIIADKRANGWEYVGKENCRLKFKRDVVKTRTETRTYNTVINNETTVIIIQDTSGSFDNAARDLIRTSVLSWESQFRLENDWTGKLGFLDDDSERVWKSIDIVRNNTVVDKNNVPITLTDHLVIINFTNEASPSYHAIDLIDIIDVKRTPFIEDFNTHKNDYLSLQASGGDFHGLLYPIAFARDTFERQSAAFIQHAMAAIKGGVYSLQEAQSTVGINPFIAPDIKGDIITSITNPNPYTEGLEQYGWKGIFSRGWDPGFIGMPIITPEQFQQDMAEYMEATNAVVEEEITVEYIEEEYSYVEGRVFNPNLIDASWTLSYSLKTGVWTSWHSYLPYHYISTSDSFISLNLKYRDFLYGHSKNSNYCTFYGEVSPHIIEFVDKPQDIGTRTWESLAFIVKAERFDEDLQQYVEERYGIFNKMIAYNSRQCTGLMNIIPKDLEEGDYLHNQVTNEDTFTIDRNERHWYFNDIRDYRVNYNAPIWNSNLRDLQDNYFIDKALNEDAIDFNKDWYELESMRDKYLVIRLIFDKFVNINYKTTFAISELNPSER